MKKNFTSVKQLLLSGLTHFLPQKQRKKSNSYDFLALNSWMVLLYTIHKKNLKLKARKLYYFDFLLYKCGKKWYCQAYLF